MRTLTILLTVLATFTMKAETLYLTIGDKQLTATMPENVSTRALRSLLADGPLTVQMHDYGGWEKVGSLPQSLPSDDRYTTAVPGDIMLYQSRDVVIFYGNNSWAYTPLGHINGLNASELKSVLGNGNVTVTFLLTQTSGIEGINQDPSQPETVYNLQGHKVTSQPLPPGVYLSENKKFIIK